MIFAVLWLYRAFVALAVIVAIPVLAVRDRRKNKRRPSWSSRFMRRLPELPQRALWIHAVSVGEVEVARRLIVELDSRGRREPIILTVTTATGLDLARKSLADRVTVMASPIDLPGPVKRFLSAARPKALVLVETELWPEMLHQVSRHDLPVVVVNARLSEASFRAYHRVRAPLAVLLRPVTLVLARDTTDVERFRALGIDPGRVRVGGNVKYDLTKDDRPLEWAQALPGITGGRPVIVAGSTMDGEEAMVLDALDRLQASGSRPFLVLAPRHPERFEAVWDLLQNRGLSTVRRSTFESHNDAADVLLIDTIGELARSYQFASMAFIGGSLVLTGGHNPLEPAVWGVPVLTGPHVFNFEEIYRVLGAAGASKIVTSPGELAETMAEWLNDPAECRRRGSIGRQVVDRNRGATALIVDALTDLFS